MRALSSRVLHEGRPGYQSGLAHAPFADADARMIAALARVLGEEPALASAARATARTLFYGAHGLAEHATDVPRMEREIVRLVRVHRRGAPALARAHPRR